MTTGAFNNLSGIGRGGTGVLKVYGREVARQTMERTLPLILQWDENFDVGADAGTPLDDQDCQVPFAFTGKLAQLTLTVDRPQLMPEDEKRLAQAQGQRPIAARILTMTQTLHGIARTTTRGLVLAGVLVMPWAAVAQQPAAPPADEDGQTLDLAKKAQNPIADLISLPLQNNLNFGYGAKDAPHSSSTQYVLNIQPVVPVEVTDELNLITRPILPVIRQPDLIDGGETWGLGDIQLQTYLSPSKSDKPIWGIGPVFQFPSATNGKKLGTQKWSAGPGAVALVMPGKWVVGGLINNLWAFAGDSDRKNVNLMTVQPFVNYNFEHGWYVSTSPVITANWEADDDDTWTVPLGGGFGRIIRLGKLPVNLQAQAFYNVVKPDDDPTADWTLRLQVQFLLPR